MLGMCALYLIKGKDSPAPWENKWSTRPEACWKASNAAMKSEEIYLYINVT
jgi:hypothetical protein